LPGSQFDVVDSHFAPVVLGLASAACWGAGDFSGGLATKRANVYSVVIASQVVGGVLLIGLALALAEQMPSPGHMLWGGAAGLAGAIGLMALYRALATGKMGAAAPVSAVITAAVPVVFGAFFEGLPSALKLIGFGLALIGVWLVSRTEEATIRWNELRLPLLAGLGFGIFLLLIDRANETAVLWPLVASRIASLSAVFAFAIFTRQPRLPEAKHLPLMALAGAMDAAGNAFYALAAQVGRLDVAAVLSSLYPATTVWLAWLMLKERISRPQTIGIVATLAAIVLIAASGG
jgi:drug/metabolite transporter (DMT)-like permease